MDETYSPVIRRPQLAKAADILRPTRAEIDLAGIEYNLEQLRSVSPHARILAVIKADGYGHGALPVAKRLEANNVFGFGVALAEEALELREAGITSDILILNGVVGNAHREVLERGLTPVIYDLDQVRKFAESAKAPFRFHLKIDTGMRRLGVPFSELETFLERLKGIPFAQVDGIMTHLAAGHDTEFTTKQLGRFDQAVRTAAAAGYQPRWLHAANTAAIFSQPKAQAIYVPGDPAILVRPGIGLFGHHGFDGSNLPTLRSTLRLRTEVVSLRSLRLGDRAGYDGTFVANRRTRLAVLPIGYGDGLLRSASGRGEMLIEGRRCPIVGQISMDLTHIDVTDVPGIQVHDEVIVLGSQKGRFGEDELRASDLAKAAGTIPYEVLTSISRRVPRFYS